MKDVFKRLPSELSLVRLVDIFTIDDYAKNGGPEVV